MLFNSFEFIIFVLLFFAGWPLLRKRNNSRWLYLTAASFFFYGWWDWRFIFLLIVSGLVDFLAGLAMTRWPGRKKAFLIASLLANLGSLAAFKYLDFFIGNLNGLASLFSLPGRLPLAHLILPVGISFYTFQSLSYTIDIYRGQLTPTRNVLHFFAYLAMFPQLVAGPIVRAADLLPQLEKVNPTTEQTRWSGMTLIMLGYFKKVVVADSLAMAVNEGFAYHLATASAAYWWTIMTLFAFQIYCDFSGYSDIARGLARWMGCEFPLNFDHPYLAAGFRDFWTRWHISLSTWFRDYLYFPLGGSRGTVAFGLRNLTCVMLISGLWHGAAWTFVAWAALHAGYLALERLTHWPQILSALPAGRHLTVLATFLLTVLAWTFFRAESFPQALTVLTRMFDFAHFNLADAFQIPGAKTLLLAALMIARQIYIHLGLHHRQPARPALAFALQTVTVSILIVTCIYLRGPGSDFIYFQF